MTTVYKYCSPRGVAILQTLELKITPPNQFNDPFEFTPRMICSAPMRRARDILKKKKNLRILYEGEREAGLFFGNFRDYRRIAKQRREKIAQGIAGYLPEAAAEVKRNLLDKVSKEYGLLCLSKRRDSILMWGHYSDKHRGIVIGVDASHDVFRAEKGLRPVAYVRERVTFDSTWEERDPRLSVFEDQVIFSKNDDWSYEQELRQFFRLSSLVKKPLDDKSLGYFMPLPPEVVTSVTLGVRCPVELMEEVQVALHNPRLSHVKLDRAVLHESEFALQFG